MQRSLLIALAVLSVPLIVGCEGCQTVRSNPNADQEDERAPRAAYSTEPAIVFPHDQNTAFGAVKPGHWMTAAQSIRSNKADMRGQLRSRSSVAIQNVDLETTGTLQSSETIRPVVLPKGQMRQFDFRIQVPIPKSVDTRRINLSSRLIPRSGGIFDTGGQPFSVMQPAEYYFVILTKRPERFARLQVADWVRFKEDEINTPLQTNNYRISIPDADGLLTLPETMLDMTSIGAILWDDVSEDALTPLQQRALADWLRFGGRLIINGPAASEAIANTAIADVLPLYPTSNIELDPDAAVELLKTWSVESDRSLDKQIEVVRSESSRIALDGRLEPGAAAIPGTASLILSKRVGRGHSIQPRFDITGQWIETWKSYDSFFNGVMLNRPGREFVPAIEVAEADSMSEVSMFFEGTRRRSDAAVNTQFRITARDSILEGTEDGSKGSGSLFDRYSRVDAMTGLSAWTDYSDTVKMFREALTSEAGIKIPQSSLVINSLAIYLVVLVPLNYIVFRLMDRLEYAWFAVPVIAVVGAIYAARKAQLDIGFARSHTELALLEVHADYPRGHLSRVVGVYNSLSSRYEVQFPTVNGLATPLEGEPDPGTQVESVNKNSFEEGPSLDDFAVASNRMRYVHTEELVDLGGAIAYDPAGKLINESGLELLDAIVIRRDADGVAEAAPVGGLLPGETSDLEFFSADKASVPSGLPMQASLMMRKFANPQVMPPGSTRLIARIDGSVEGMTISPNASQRTAQTIALVHLVPAKLDAPGIDANLASDFRRVNTLESDDPAANDAERESNDAASGAESKVDLQPQN